MKVLLTGSDGFIGRNLEARLSALNIKVVKFTRDMFSDGAPFIFDDIDFVFHLAGVNRPKNEMEFTLGNVDLTKELCDAIALTGRNVPILFTSSVQAVLQNSYGLSKLAAENLLITLSQKTGSPTYIYRLTNVFGRWSKPNYNSVVATFCHNIANNLPITINDKNALIHLVYIDDVINDFLFVLRNHTAGIFYRDISPVYETSVGELADQIIFIDSNYQKIKNHEITDNFLRCLHSTYVSFKSINQ